MTNDQILRKLLLEKSDANDVRCTLLEYMWVVEVVKNGADLSGRKKIREKIHNIVMNKFQDHTIWKAFVYGHSDHRYTAQGTLHTLPMTLENGIPTSTLAANDCYLDVTEFDAEVLQIGPPAGHIVLAKESMNEKQPVLGYQLSIQHAWLETMGVYYPLDKKSVSMIQNAQHPYEMTIKLKNTTT